MESVYSQRVSKIINCWAKGKPYTEGSLLKAVNPNISDVTACVQAEWTFSVAMAASELTVGPNDTVAALRSQLEAVHYNHAYDYEW